MIDLGDVITPAASLTNAAGVAADAVSCVLTLTLPDGTSTSPAVTHPGTGSYTATYATTMAGLHTARWVATTITGGAAQEVITSTYEVEDSLEAIISLAELKDHLRITGTGSDEKLRATAEVATDVIENYLDRSLRRRTVVDVLDGGRSSVRLCRTPVLSITSVTDSGTAIPASGYAVDYGAGIVYRGGTNSPTWFIWGRQSVTVTYVAGPVAGVIPPRIRQAVLELARHLFTVQRGGSNLPRTQDGEGSMGGAAQLIPARVRELLTDDRAPGGFA